MRSIMARIARHAVGLLARRELDAMLEAPEHEIRVREVPLFAFGHEAVCPQAPERVDRVRTANAGLAAPYELEALREEFDLADPAPADLQVVVDAGPCLGPRAMEHPGQLVDDAGVDRAPPHEWRERAEETRAEVRVSGDGARPDEGRALPASPPRLVVAFRCRERVDQRPTRSLGTQAQVDAPHDAVVGRFVERRDEPLRDPCEMLVQRVRAARRRARNDKPVVRFVEEHEVDVAAGVELATPELAHADDRERARGAVRRDGRPEAVFGPCEGLCKGDLATDVGQVGKLAGRDVDVVSGMGEQLASRDSQLLAGRPPAKAPAHARAVGEIADGARGETPIGPEIARLPRATGEREQVFGVGVDLRRKRGIRAENECPELDELVARAFAGVRDQRRDAGPRGRGLLGRYILGAHRRSA